MKNKWSEVFVLRKYPVLGCSKDNPDLLNLYEAVAESLTWLADSKENLETFRESVMYDMSYFVQENASLLLSKKADIKYFKIRIVEGIFSFFPHAILLPISIIMFHVAV